MKRVFMSRHQIARQNHNRCFEIMARLKYLSTTIAMRNAIHEEIKIGLRSLGPLHTRMYPNNCF
jgi:hypothetical protein